jgi:hypothetical protein
VIEAPPLEPSYEAELVTGLALYLHAQGVAHFTEPETPNPHPDTVPTLYFGQFPAKPPLALALNWYADESEPRTNVTTSLVQLRFRIGDRHREMLRIVGTVRSVLHERAYLDLGRVRASKVTQRSFADLGLDTSTPRLREFTLNYAFRGMRYLHPAP